MAVSRNSLAIVLTGLLSLATSCWPAPIAQVARKAGRQATAVGWQKGFLTASRGVPRPDAKPRLAGVPRIVAISAESTPRVLARVNDIRAGQPRSDDELWASDLDGGRPVLLAEEVGRSLIDVAPGPPATGRVAYLSGPTGLNEPADVFRQSAARLADGRGRVVTVVEGGVQVPGWSADGQSLLLLHADEGGWRPCRVDPTNPAGGLVPAVPGLAFNQAPDYRRPTARFSPDGRLVAGGRNEVLTVGDLSAGTVREFPELKGRFDRLLWSPDGRRLYVQRTKVRRFASTVSDVVLNLDDGSVTPLDERLGLMAGPAPDGRVSILAAGWAPGPGYRLLLLVDTDRDRVSDVAADRAPGEAIGERRWLALDLDHATATPVEGLSTDPDLTDSTFLHFTPDGRYVAWLSTLYVLNAPL